MGKVTWLDVRVAVESSTRLPESTGERGLCLLLPTPSGAHTHVLSQQTLGHSAGTSMMPIYGAMADGPHPYNPNTVQQDKDPWRWFGCCLLRNIAPPTAGLCKPIESIS